MLVVLCDSKLEKIILKRSYGVDKDLVVPEMRFRSDSDKMMTKDYPHLYVAGEKYSLSPEREETNAKQIIFSCEKIIRQDKISKKSKNCNLIL